MMSKSPELFAPPPLRHGFVFGFPIGFSGEKAAEGLRQRKKLPDASEAPEGKEVKEGEDRCPISGKQGAESGKKNVGRLFKKTRLTVVLYQNYDHQHCPDHGDV